MRVVEELGDALGVFAASFEAQGKRGDGAQREPRLHRAEDAAGQRAPLVDLCAEFEVADGDVAEQEVAVAGHGLGVGGDGEVGSEGERKLAERRWAVVLSTATSAPARWAASQRAAMSQTSIVGLLGVSIQSSFAPSSSSACALLAVGAVRSSMPILAEVLLHQDAGGEVGVRGQDDGVAGAEDGSEDGGAGGHAGGEDECGGLVAGGRTPSGRWPFRAPSRWGCGSGRRCRGCPAGSPGVWYGAAKTGPGWSGSPGTAGVRVERMILVESRIWRLYGDGRLSGYARSVPSLRVLVSRGRLWWDGGGSSVACLARLRVKRADAGDGDACELARDAGGGWGGEEKLVVLASVERGVEGGVRRPSLRVRGWRGIADCSISAATPEALAEVGEVGGEAVADVDAGGGEPAAEKSLADGEARLGEDVGVSLRGLLIFAMRWLAASMADSSACGSAERAGDVEGVAGLCAGAAEGSARWSGAEEDDVGEDEVGGGLGGVAAGEGDVVVGWRERGSR